MTRKPGETLQELGARICQAAATCDFPSMRDVQDEALWQLLICSVNNKDVTKALFRVKSDELVFAKALQNAIVIEDSCKVAKETVYRSRAKPVNQIKDKTKKQKNTTF